MSYKTNVKKTIEQIERDQSDLDDPSENGPQLELLTLSKPEILIVDDDHDFLNLLKSALEDKFDCILAEDGSMGLKLFKERAPDLVLTDIYMPNMNGIEFLKELSKYKDTSVMVISGYDFSPNSLERSVIEMTAIDKISKPIDIDNVICRIEMALKLS